jgi:hypothetical protein
VLSLQATNFVIRKHVKVTRDGQVNVAGASINRRLSIG